MFCIDFEKFFFLTFLLGITFGEHHETNSFIWDYTRNGPDMWHHSAPICDGDSQSPVDIESFKVNYDPNLPDLSLNGYTTNTTIYVWNFTHNARGIVFSPPNSARLSINGANLPGVFDLVSVHVHWGYNSHQGSEHTIDGRKFPIEMQFLHQSQGSNSMAIFSLLFNRQEADNPLLNELLTIFNETIDESINLQRQLDLSFLFPTGPSIQYYRYTGSLTTPPCTEGITWLILKKTVPISSKQIAVFMDNSVPFNFRPVQKLNHRQIVANFHQTTEGINGNEGHGNTHGEEHGHSSSEIVRFQPSLYVLMIITMIRFFRK